MITLKVNDRELRFEHSLVSLSEWESEYERPFFSPKKEDEVTSKEMMSYFEYMVVSNPKYRHYVRLLTPEQQLILANYINKTRTGTIVRDIPGQKKGAPEIVTSELIYYWLVSFKIPFTPTDKWHLNRLLMLVKVCGAKSTPPKKSRANQRETAMTMREMNEKRLKERGTSG